MKRSTLERFARAVFATRAAKAVHWVLGILAFLVVASYTSATHPHMRADAFVKAELLIAWADAMVCLGLYCAFSWAQGRKAARRAR